MRYLNDIFNSIAMLDSAINLKQYDFVVSFGLYAKDISCNVCLNPFLNMQAESYIRYEVGTEEGITALFLHEFYKGEDIAIRNYIQMLDYGYLSAESNVSEEEMLDLRHKIKCSKKPILLIGADIYLHNQARNILSMLSYLDMDIGVFLPSNEHIFALKKETKLPYPLQTMGEHNGCVVYLDYGINADLRLRISKEFARVWRLTDNIQVEICFDGAKINTLCVIDEKFGGIIGLLGTHRFYGYPYKQAKIKQIETKQIETKRV